MYAVVTNPLGWRSIGDPSQAMEGEVVVEALPDGAGPDNSLWDATANNGAGGVRLKNADELATDAQTAATAVESAHQDAITLTTLYAVMSTRNLTPAEQTQFNMAAYRLMVRLF